MKRRYKMIRLVACLAATWVGRAEAARPATSASGRPNILWLIAEDLGPELACYGTQQVWTPNLDSLAAAGVRYTKAFTTAPVCSPSRSAFSTGMWQTTIGAHNHRSHRDDGFELPDGVRIITDRMREAGYFTANIRRLPNSMGFKGTGKTDWNFHYEGRPFDSDDWADLKTHQPFFAQINFQETHRKFHGPRRADPGKVVFPPYYPDHPVTREDWAAYLDAASELDRKVGLILKQLETDGLADNTVIFFFGDNGQAHVRGKQFCYDSGLRVPLIIRWPDGRPLPRGLRPGTVNDQLVAAIDLTATTLAIADVPRPAKMQGQVLFGDRADPPRRYVFGARDRCDETVFRFRTVRDGRYRYIRNFTPDRPFLQPNEYKERAYPVWNLLKQLHAEGKLTPVQDALCAPTMPAEELYDLETDPYEIHNLSSSSEHRDVLERLRQVLEKWIEESDDQGRIPEDPKVAARQGVTRPGSDPMAGYAPTALRSNVATRPVVNEDARTIIEREIGRTKPDYVVYRPGSVDGSTFDTGNEHFLVFDGPDGSLMTVWTQSSYEGAGDHRIVFSRSRDNGRTWTPPKRLVGPRRPGDGRMASWGFPLLSRTGRIYVIYNQYQGIDDVVHQITGTMDCVYSDDNGGTWSPPQTIPMQRSPYDHTDAKVPSNWIVWQKPIRDLEGRWFTGFTRWVSKAVRTPPCVNSWTALESVVEFMRFENIDEDPQPRDIRISYSAWGAKALRVPHYLDPRLSIAQEPSLVRLPDKRLFCVMRTMTGYIWYSVSGDDGLTWCSPRPLLRRDKGQPILEPLCCCPIYECSEGGYVLLHHNNDGRFQGSKREETGKNRRPAFMALGEFRPGADQPIWFSESKQLMDNDGVGIGPLHRIDIGVYPSVTKRDGEFVLWHPDRKFFLLGKRITPEWLADLSVPSP